MSKHKQVSVLLSLITLCTSYLSCLSFKPPVTKTTQQQHHYPPTTFTRTIITTSNNNNNIPTTTLRYSSHDEENEAFVRNQIRTDVKRFLTQRSVQSFMFLLQKCRDPHTVKWIEEFGGLKNMLSFHGTGALNTTRFDGWDSFLLEMMERKKEVIVFTARRRGRGGSLSGGSKRKKNPYMEEKFVEFEVDIDPVSLASRILSVREQIGKEWIEDLDTVVYYNENILTSYHDRMMNKRDDEEEYDSQTTDEEGSIEEGETTTATSESTSPTTGNYMPEHTPSDFDSSDFARPYTSPEKLAYERNAMSLLKNRQSIDDEHTSSPLRMSNFDLLILLCTQESVHRVLRHYRDMGPQGEVTFEWLLNHYTDRVSEYFDGPQRYGRADDFLEEMLLTPPSFRNGDDGKSGFIDPLGVAQEIIKMRTEVAMEWKELVLNVPQDHMGVRKELLALQMKKVDDDAPQSHIEVIEAGDFE